MGGFSLIFARGRSTGFFECSTRRISYQVWNTHLLILKCHLFKYLPPNSPKSQPEYVEVTSPVNFAARASKEPALTAFAQLGALRLGAQRVIISLFGRHEQHVLTEATRTISLQDNIHHTPDDQPWIGCCTLSYARRFCKAAMQPQTDAQSACDQVIVQQDLLQDDALKDHPDVKSFPNIRFVASSPIISPKGIVIGAYTVLDNKPREALDITSLEFLVDMSLTVMEYLDTSHSRSQHYRSERMMVSIGSFLEGKGSLRSSWLTDTEDAQTAGDENNEGHINRKQQDKQISERVAKSMASNGPKSHLPFHSYNLDRPQKQSSQTYGEQNQSSEILTASISELDAQSQASQAEPSVSDQSKQPSRKEEYALKVKEAFARGANLIRESIQVEAVIFFDANYRSQIPLEESPNSDSESSTVEGFSSGDEEARSREAARQRELSTAEQASAGGQTALDPCEIIAFATSSTSSINDELMNDKRIALSESFLNELLTRYPQGKIFNYGEDGALSSDDASDSVFRKYLRRHKGRKYKRTERGVLRQDAETLLRLAPDSRSIIFSPQWDSNKGRWYSGSLTWTRAKHRVFTSDDELAFLLTFGHSLMAEVHRLHAQFTDQAKGDLLAGLSHELRSPLHGIFGTVELLNDTSIDTLQRGSVHTIASCAFTLLGSINQLLEYASINDIPTYNSIGPAGFGSKTDRPGVRSRSKPGNLELDSYVELDAAVEDAVETVVAGYAFFNITRSPLRGVAGLATQGAKAFDSHGGVKVILDIEPAPSWKFSTRPGAWHVILTNLLGNALKFTQQGHILVSLKSSSVRLGKDGAPKRSKIMISIKDTGCGIGPEYMKNDIFAAFEQEDSMSTGNGLGLNITRRIVSSLGGDIQLHSEPDVGTESVITVNLDHISELDTPEDVIVQSPIPATRALLSGKSIGLLGLGNSTFDMALCASLERLCQDWLGMAVRAVSPADSRFAHCDFYISTHEYLDMGNMEIKSIAPGEKQHFSSPVIIICPSPRIAHSMFVQARKRGDTEVLQFISQPCGPRKLAKALDISMKRQQQRSDLAQGKSENVDRSSRSRNRTDSDERNRYSLVHVPELGVGGQSGAEVTNNQSSIYSHGPETSFETNQSRENVNDINSSEYPSESPAEEPSEKQDQPQPEPEVIPSMAVLLVDDNEINLRMLVAFMKKVKCDYLQAHDGKEALELFKENAYRIKVILMGKSYQHRRSSGYVLLTSPTDISMPVMDGLESTRRIRDFENEEREWRGHCRFDRACPV
ncbi:unnamed protein product [Penicillium olsonii]|nr:unnamed protein product [Penicillium olsonii]